MTLWQIIENGRIRLKDGVIMGRDGEVFRSSLTTYFIGIARFKYLEWCRSIPDAQTYLDECANVNSPSENDIYKLMFGDSETLYEDIIRECISSMSQRCYEILSKFYYERKPLDTIIVELPSFSSKDALKTEKYKCMVSLKNAANNMYEEKSR